MYRTTMVYPLSKLKSNQLGYDKSCCRELTVLYFELHCTNILTAMCIVSQKNDTDVAHYNFNAHQPFLVIFGRDVAERVCYQMVICYPTSPN